LSLLKAVDHANVKFPPPLVPLVFAGIGFVLDRLVLAAPLVPNPLRFWLGGSITGISIIFIVYCAVIFKKHKTAIEPWATVTAIIKVGPYRYTRNPIYLAMVAGHIGLALCVNSWWAVGGLIPVVIIFNEFVIKREEVYLISKFGEEYINYKNSVRRWI